MSFQQILKRIEFFCFKYVYAKTLGNFSTRQLNKKYLLSITMLLRFKNINVVNEIKVTGKRVIV